jgi:hypothetical protein
MPACLQVSIAPAHSLHGVTVQQRERNLLETAAQGVNSEGTNSNITTHVGVHRLCCGLVVSSDDITLMPACLQVWIAPAHSLQFVTVQQRDSNLDLTHIAGSCSDKTNSNLTTHVMMRSLCCGLVVSCDDNHSDACLPAGRDCARGILLRAEHCESKTQHDDVGMSCIAFPAL